jgi:hypothetical protein
MYSGDMDLCRYHEENRYEEGNENSIEHVGQEQKRQELKRRIQSLTKILRKCMLDHIIYMSIWLTTPKK